MAEDDGLAHESAADDLDPAAPLDMTEAPRGEDAERTNYGSNGRGELPEGEAEEEDTENPGVLSW